MTTKTCALLAMLGVGFSLACNNRTDAPPEFNAPITTSDGTTLMPIRLAKHDKASVSGGATSESSASADKGSTGTASGGTAATVEIKDSTPEELASTLIEIIKAGSLSQIPDLLVPEQREAVQQLFTALQPVLDANAELKKVLDEKFAGHAIQLSGAGGMPGGLPQEMTITDIKTEGDDAEGTVHATSSTGEEKTEPIKFKRVDGKWKVASTEMAKAPPPEQLEKLTGAMNKLAEAMRDVAKRVADGEITDAKAAEEELGKAAMGAVMGMMGGMGTPDANGDDKPADSSNEEKPAEPKKSKKDEPDPLDGTMPGPGVLRRG